jgi:tetratricopeptide (TPR) repeat protein
VTETLLQRANLLNRRSRARDAMPVIENALMLAQTVGNRYQELRLQFLQGAAYRNLGDIARATERARSAIESAASENMDNLATSGLIDLGNSYLTVGNYEAAEPYFRRALDTARRGKVRRIEARAQLSMGSLCEQDHRPEEARQFIEAGLSFYRQAGYLRESVQAAVLLGGVLQQLGQNEDGVRVLRETLPNALRLQDQRVEAQLRERIGENLSDQGEWASALSEYQRVIELYGRLEQAALARVAAARALRNLGRRDQAERWLAEAEDFETTNRSPRLLAAIQIEGAQTASADGRLQDARRLALAALTYFEPRKAWEQVWRAHAIVAMSSTAGVEAQAHLAAARTALSQFQAGRPSASVTRYLERDDIKRLSEAVRAGDSVRQ